MTQPAKRTVRATITCLAVLSASFIANDLRAGSAQLPPPAQGAAAAQQLRLSKLVQVSITTRDLPRAVVFYRDVLGLNFLFESNGMAFFQAGDLHLMVGLARNGIMTTGGATIYFDAGDWRATEAALLARGVIFDHPAEVVERADGKEHALREFADPDGNRLAIMGWRPRT
jgi:catechol 2,3-dioxygenase-like lactoylglutathione lyase family enzyme